MRSLRLTSLLAIVIAIASCKQDLGTTILAKSNVLIDGAQVVPSKSVAGNGTMDLAYNRTTRVLSYTIKWNSLSGNPNAMHIHGPAGAGFNAPIVQNITGYAASQTGTLTGTFFVDGYVVKEEDVLRGGYYLDIHTAANSTGEIRGQVVVQ